MSRPPPTHPIWPVWLYCNETINNITSYLLNQIQWIEYLTTCLDVLYDIEDLDANFNELFQCNMMYIKVCSLAYHIKKVGMMYICSCGESDGSRCEKKLVLCFHLD
jgi:predicted membrane channel-forming protein YqfA (hemolysin III family)